MSYPNVTAVMITRNRPALRERALKCFDAQTYEPKNIVVLDSSDGIGHETKGGGSSVVRVGNCVMAYRPPDDLTIGELRNMAVGLTTRDTDIIVTFDDDDHSHPERISEQVELLQASGADAAGYNEMLFWREGQRRATMRSGEWHEPGQAWLYTNRNPTYCLGTSLCYWRRTWEAKPFSATSRGEDIQWCIGLNTVGVSSRPITFDGPGSWARPGISEPSVDSCTPRMIARIHAGNTSTAYKPEKMAQASEWRRVPEWDAYCRSVME
jgi:glycosyltransferase involved in cell wall biosynthesis